MNLGYQIAASLLLMMLLAVVHGLGILLISKLLRLEEERLQAHPIDVTAFVLVAAVAVALFALHMTEIGIFAGFYLWVGALADAEAALFFSASAYSTLANTVEGFPDRWRLIGAIEGLVGFLLIGWSTAVFVADMQILFRKKRIGTSQ